MPDNETRDQLAFILATAQARFAGELADAAIAKGWRPPARVITTTEELDALQPAQDVIDSGRNGANCWAAVICDAQGQVLTRDVDNLEAEVNEGRHAGWWLTGSPDDIDSSTLTYPVTVLCEPEESQR